MESAMELQDFAQMVETLDRVDPDGPYGLIVIALNMETDMKECPVLLHKDCAIARFTSIGTNNLGWAASPDFGKFAMYFRNETELLVIDLSSATKDGILWFLLLLQKSGQILFMECDDATARRLKGGADILRSFHVAFKQPIRWWSLPDNCKPMVAGWIEKLKGQLGGLA